MYVMGGGDDDTPVVNDGTVWSHAGDGRKTETDEILLLTEIAGKIKLTSKTLSLPSEGI